MPRLAHNNLPPLKLDGMTIGQRIRTARQASGYTQAQLAEKIGIAQTLVSDYERGKINPAAEMLIRFAKALDTTTDQLLGLGKPDKRGKTHGNTRLVQRLKKLESLPKKQQMSVIEHIDALIAANCGKA